MTTQIGIISGKGGTGKTTVAAAFAALSRDTVMIDCDVDAPDLHILLQPSIKTTEEFIGSKVAYIDTDACTECGLCEEHCRFDAAHPPNIDPIACEGCGVCEYVCPVDAVNMRDRISGHLYSSMTHFGPMAHARLMAGEGNSGKLVTEVRKLGEFLAKEHNRKTILIDGSPGIGCPVIATVTGLTLGVIVTEPTMSGIHDMERVLSLLERFRVRPAVIINKYDLNIENTERIESLCRERGVTVLGRIKFDSITTESMVAAQTLPEYAPDHPITHLLDEMWSEIIKIAQRD